MSGRPRAVARRPAAIAKRSITIAGHRTSVSLEAPFWTALTEIARNRGVSVQALVAEVDAARGESNLSSALRICVLRHLQHAQSGPARAG